MARFDADGSVERWRSDIRPKDIHKALSDLTPHIQILAKADGAISRIVYWIEEKGQSLPVWLDRNYVARLEAHARWTNGDENPETEHSTKNRPSSSRDT